MPTATSQDTEITLGTGKMLALFFGLVALCAVFFGMGFSLGRSSVRIASPEVPAATTVTTGGQRPSAVKNANATTPADMTFYKAVESKEFWTNVTGTSISTSQRGSRSSPASPPLTASAAPGSAPGTEAMTTAVPQTFSAVLHPTALNWLSPCFGSLT